MPDIRRSKRNKKKINSCPPESTPKQTPNHKKTQNPCKQSVEKNTETIESSEQNCQACKQKFTPIARYKKPKWIQCNHCENWWHAECACLSIETIQKFEAQNIDYTCALCVLKGSPWILEKNEINCVTEIRKEDNIKPESLATDTLNTDKPQTELSMSEKVLPASEENQIIIIDNLPNAQEFRSSLDIEKQIKNKEIEGVQFSYSLPKGGVALQFKNKEKAEKTLKEWPSGVFHEKEVPHFPRGKEGIKIGYMKNVDLRLPESEIKSELEKSGISLIDVHRCYHRHSGVRMPVVRLSFHSNKDLQVACQKKISISYRGRSAFIEPQRQKTIIRCYNCMRYSHIAANCSFEVRCESCGETGHTDRDCRNPVKCANCKEEHKASSKQCPVFKEKLKEIYKQRILQ